MEDTQEKEDNFNAYDYDRMKRLDRGNFQEAIWQLPGDVGTIGDLKAAQLKIVNDIKEEIDYLKEGLKNTRAVVEMKYHTGEIQIKNKKNKVLEKLTASIIKAVVECNVQVQIEQKTIHTKQKVLNEEQYKLDKLNGVLKSLQDKKDSIKQLKEMMEYGLLSSDFLKNKNGSALMRKQNVE